MHCTCQVWKPRQEEGTNVPRALSSVSGGAGGKPQARLPPSSERERGSRLAGCQAGEVWDSRQE